MRCGPRTTAVRSACRTADSARMLAIVRDMLASPGVGCARVCTHPASAHQRRCRKDRPAGAVRGDSGGPRLLVRPLEEDLHACLGEAFREALSPLDDGDAVV